MRLSYSNSLSFGWFSMVCYGMMRYGTLWHGTACGCFNKRYGMAWYGKIWYVMSWDSVPYTPNKRYGMGVV